MRFLLLVMGCAVGVGVNAAAAAPVPVRHALGPLQGFPSLSDSSGNVIAHGQLTQELADDRLTVRTRWSFAGGLQVEERDVFLVGRELVQEQFSWIEQRAGEEVRRFEVDLTTGKAVAAVRGQDGKVNREEAQLDLPHGRSFAGYGVVLVASELGLEPGGTAKLTFVAFTTKPRAVTLVMRRDGEEHIPVAGRSVPCDRYTLHPEIPFPLNLFASVKDAHLWLTRAEPPALVRAEGVPGDQGRPGRGHRRDAPLAGAQAGDSAVEARDRATPGAVATVR